MSPTESKDTGQAGSPVPNRQISQAAYKSLWTKAVDFRGYRKVREEALVNLSGSDTGRTSRRSGHQLFSEDRLALNQAAEATLFNKSQRAAEQACPHVAIRMWSQ